MDPFLEGFLDMSNMNWNVLGDVMNPQDPLSMGMFGYGGFPAANNSVMDNNGMGTSQFQ